jgi:hypothetical protein
VRATKALYPEAFGQEPAGAAAGEPAEDAAGTAACSTDPDASDERIAVGLEPVMIHGLTAGYEDDPPIRGPRWWHQAHRARR